MKGESLDGMSHGDGSTDSWISLDEHKLVCYYIQVCRIIFVLRGLTNGCSSYYTYNIIYT